MARHMSILLNRVSRVGWPQPNGLLEVSLAPANSQTVPRSPLEEGGLFRAKTVPGTTVMLQQCRKQLQLPGAFPCPVLLTNVDIVLSGRWNQRKKWWFACRHSPSCCARLAMNSVARRKRLLNNAGQAALPP